VHGYALKLGVEGGEQAHNFDVRILAQNVKSPGAVFAAAPGEEDSLHVWIINGDGVMLVERSSAPE
jgi:hypothetical protein